MADAQMAQARGNALNAQAQANTAMNRNAQQNQENNGRDRPNRFERGAREQIANAYLGTSSVRFLRDATGGQEDIPKRIKMAIQKQYWTWEQAVALFFMGMGLMMGISALVFVYEFEAIEYSVIGGNTMDKVAFILLGIWVITWFGMYETRGRRKCNPNNERVKTEGKPGAPCYDDLDCSDGLRPIPGACSHVSRQGIRGGVRSFVFWASPIAFVGFYIASLANTTDKVTTQERYVSASIGVFAGIMVILFFS